MSARRCCRNAWLHDAGLLNFRWSDCPFRQHSGVDRSEEVVAFVVGEAELDALCLQHIARFKRPKRYVFVERLMLGLRCG